MLTNHCYQNIKPDWDSQTSDSNRRKIIDCCAKPPDDGSGGDCCYNDWDNQLKKVNQDYKAAIEESELAKRKLTSISDRRDRYKNWVNELEKVEEKGRYICQQLEVIATQTRKIWYNACKTVKAVEILYCMITDFFFQLDGLQKKHDELMNCVNNNHDQAIGKGTGILKYTDEYLAKLLEIIKMRDDMVKPMLEAIKLANLIRNSISTSECPAGKDPKTGNAYDPCNPEGPLCPDCCDEGGRYYGLKAVMCEWYQEFNCGVICDPIDPCLSDEQRAREMQKREEARKAAAKKKEECDEEQDPKPIKCECELEPTFTFPICNDEYKWRIERWLTKDEKAIDALRKELTETIKKKESLQACKDSLTKALKEVDPKERCK